MKTFKMQIVNLFTSTFQHKGAVFMGNTYLAWLDRGLEVKINFTWFRPLKQKAKMLINNFLTMGHYR